MIEARTSSEARSDEILTAEALEFVAALHDQFDATRRQLLAARSARQTEFDAGSKPDFLPETASVREGDWKVASIPADLADRRVEITGPVDRKMIINALNSGARTFMADFEDSNSPTYANAISGQLNLMDAIRRRIDLEQNGKQYELSEDPAVLLVRPRGWHLVEQNVTVDGEPVSGALFDFGLYFFHNARELIERGSGPYFYLPKLESHHEARLWNDVFAFSQAALDIPHGTIKATVLIETLTAAFEMDEILYELRDHSAGLNAGRWDYIFSVIKKMRNDPAFLMPDRDLVTMSVPFMEAYTDLLVQTCHRRGAHAMGGMAAFIPNRRDPEVTEQALAKVRADKEKEARKGHDGTWVAHPDLIAVAMEAFDAVMGESPNQIDNPGPNRSITQVDLLEVPAGAISEAGLRKNVSVGIRYIASWINGVGAAAIFNLMEDAATAEISRSQIWQWVNNDAQLDDGRTITPELVKAITKEETDGMRLEFGADGYQANQFETATDLFLQVALSPKFEEFLTLPAYEILQATN